MERSYFLNFFVGPLLHACLKVIGRWGGGPQDYSVSPSPLLAPLGPFGVEYEIADRRDLRFESKKRAEKKVVEN